MKLSLQGPEQSASRWSACLAVALLALAAPRLAAEAPGAPANDTWLVAGGTVVTMDGANRVIEDGAVAIAGSTIVAVGTRAELATRYPSARTLEAAGGIVMPGLINAHTHAPMTLFRGLADDLPLMEWLETVIFPAEARHVDEEFVRWGTRLACLEMLRGGITTFVDMYYFEDAIAEEAERCGLRAIVGQTLIDFPAPDHPTFDSAVAATRRFLERWRGHPRITAAVAPHAPYTVSGDHLLAARALADEFDAPLLVHLAEDRAEVERLLAREGKRPVRWTDEIGLLADRVIAAHVVWPDAEEIAILARRGVGAVHCPQSNMKVGAGVSPVPALLAAGVAVGLGTDGPASNNDLDLWEEIDTAAKLHKLIAGDPTVLPAATALGLATIGGARAIDMEGAIGSLEPGKRADLIVVGMDGFHHQPLYDPLSALVYATGAADVESVVVDGELVVENGRVLTLDAERVLAEARRYRERIRAGFAAAARP